MSWRSRPTTSCWSTTAPRRCRCRSCRCSRCCRAPAGSPASPTSARCAATTPICSAPPRKASRASARSTGGWSTRWCRARNSKMRYAARAQGIRREVGRPAGAKGIKLTPLKRERSPNGAEYSAVVGRACARRAARHHHAARARRAAAEIGRRDGGAGRGVLAAAARARARRRHPRHPPQRVRHRGDRVQVVGRSGAGARLRRLPRRQQGSLAGARDQEPCGSACSSASISPRARWSRWSSRARALPARSPSSCSPPTAPTC